MNHRIAVLLGMLVSTVTVASANADSAQDYFRLKLQTGQRYADIFSKAISVKGDGFDEIVRRVSGTATYQVTDPDPAKAVFVSSYRYDGRPVGSDTTELHTDGTSCYNGKCAIDDETSGLAFNPLLWGVPPGDLHVGLQWTHAISQSWEAGPPGTETVKVIMLDPAEHLVMLERKGHGSGPSDDDQNKLPITVGGKNGTALVAAGPSDWTGQTLFRDGIIISDEILVERHVTLHSDLGTFEGEEREYTLLNAMPAPEQAKQ